jgi:hypothetical protein
VLTCSGQGDNCAASKSSRWDFISFGGRCSTLATLCGMRFRYLLRLLVPVIALILILILSLILSILYRAAVIFTSAQDCQTYASATVRTLRTQEHTNQVQIHMALCSARDQTKSGGESI